MTVRTLDFDFARCYGSPSGTLRRDGDSWFFDRYLTARMLPVASRMVVLNGVNVNTQVPLVGQLGSTGVFAGAWPLVMAAPASVLYPLLSAIGGGPVYGIGFKWRYRYKNRFTGDVSGLSPSPPWPINMGKPVSTGASEYLGQTAYFRIACGIHDIPAYCDTIQLFRNFSGDESVWTLVKELDITAAQSGTGYIDFIDDVTDTDLAFHETTSGIQPNPSFSEGMIPQCVKAHPHSTGRLLLYGTLKEFPYRQGTVFVTVGSSVVTRTDTTTMFTPNKVGQRFRLVSITGTAIDDTTVYQIVEVPSDPGNGISAGAVLRVTPHIQISTQLPTQGTTYTSVSYEILDDRSPRSVFPSEPGDPTSFDLLRSFDIGFDADDALLHIFTLRGVTYGQTATSIYRLINDTFTEPVGTVAATVTLQRVAPDGTTGFSSGCLTPFGWVFVHPTRGVLLFDGNAPPQGYETIGTTSPCVPLGRQLPTEIFGPMDQFLGAESDAYVALTGASRTGFEPSLLSEAHCCYDPQSGLVHVFYVPSGDWTLCEELSFDAEVQCWRGPWRNRVATSHGTFKNSDGTELFCFGEDTGGIWIDNRQGFDLYPATVPASASSTSGVGSVFVNSGASFDSTTFKEKGSSIVLSSPTGAGTANHALETTRIVDVIDGTTLVLQHPVVQSGYTWTYRIGGVRWLAQFAWIDADEPIQPKTCERLRARIQRPASGASSSVFGVLIDGNEDLSAVTGELGVPFTVSYDTNFPAHRDVRIEVGSRLFAPVAYGTSVTGDMKATKLVADLRIDAGS